jgi:hypothetical protein
MTNENDSNNPTTDLQGQSPLQPPEKSEANELAREFRIAEKWVIGTNIILAVIGIIALCIYGGQLRVMRGQLQEIIRQYPELQQSAEAANKSATWTRDQAINVFKDQRPRMWAKIPDRIHIEVGKPIRPDIQVFNYGKVPGIARARIRFEAATGVIEKFRDTLRNHPADFLVPDQVGTWKVLINPNDGKRFPIEKPELVLSKQDMEQLTGGTIDVAIYGRIFYTDLNNSATDGRNDEYQSSFCFYVMRDGTTMSACTNKYNKSTQYEEYTNWAQ